MFKNDIPAVDPLSLKTTQRLGFKRYYIITHYLQLHDYYNTVIYPKRLFSKNILTGKKNKFSNFCYRATTERQAKRNHARVVNAFKKGKKAVYKLGNGNLKD